MSDFESIQYDVMQEQLWQEMEWDEASRESALEQCIYLFVEGESEEIAFRILLEEGLGISFSEYGVVIANYNGIGNLKHLLRIMIQTLSHARPMIFTYDDDDPSKVPEKNTLPSNVYLFKVPCTPTVTLSNGRQGGSFEESFNYCDFINACFETNFLKDNPQISKQSFIDVFKKTKPFYAQIVKFLKSQGASAYVLPKPEIADYMAVSCTPVPDTYTKLADLIKQIRTENPVNVKI